MLTFFKDFAKSIHYLFVYKNTVSGFSFSINYLVLWANKVEEFVVPTKNNFLPFYGSSNTLKVFLYGLCLFPILVIGELT